MNGDSGISSAVVLYRKYFSSIANIIQDGEVADARKRSECPSAETATTPPIGWGTRGFEPATFLGRTGPEIVEGMPKS